MKADIILLKYGEISLKGLNRPMFEKQLLANVAKALAPLGKFSIRKSQSTVYVEPLGDDIDMQAATGRLSKVFGIVNICPAAKCQKTIEDIERTTLECLSQIDLNGKTFKVEAKREDKQFPMNSPQLCRHMGAVILKNTEGLSVDVHNPDILVQIEIRKEAFIFTQKVSGAGGMLAEMLTAVSGASECFDGSFVTYANEQKEKMIGVRHETLEKYGAVSHQTALEMSRGARLALGADIGAGVTGIAGPGGGTPEKPVGLVYISISTEDIHCFCRLNLDGDRFEVRRKTCLYVLELVKRTAV